MLALADRRVLVTRARGRASALAAQLEALGATAILIPAIELTPPASYDELDIALDSIGNFDWVIFTSASAVRAVVERAQVLGLRPRATRMAAIGPATAKAIVDSGVADGVDLIPAQSVAESLAEALRPQAAGAKMLLVRAAVARDVLPEALAAAGATVTIAEAYRTVIPRESIEDIRGLFASRPPAAITFTSASTAQNLVALFEAAQVTLPAGIVLASIGPITSQAMRELNLKPTVEAREASIAALAVALAEWFTP